MFLGLGPDCWSELPEMRLVPGAGSQLSPDRKQMEEPDSFRTVNIRHFTIVIVALLDPDA